MGAMVSPRFNRRLIPAMVALSIPVISVFVVLAAGQRIALWPALAGCLATLVLNLLLLRPYGADLERLSAYIRELSRGKDAPPPELRTVLAADVTAALGQLRRVWALREEDLEKRVAFHQSLFDSLPDPLFLVSQQRRVVSANPAARAVFGRALEGRDLAGVLRNPPLLDAAERALQGEAGQEVEFTIGAPVERDYRALVEPLHRLGPDGCRLILALHDITALKRMEQMRADFVANASHELRTPLSALLGFIETLQGPARDDAEARERFLSIMQEQASRMSRLVADLLNLSRIELNEHTPPQGKADVGAILRRITEGLEPQAQRRRMTVSLDLPDTLPAVTGQDDELAQLLQNLVDNALKYGREGTTVQVSARATHQLPASLAERTGQAVAIGVRDQGEGIAREHIPRLTERFFRVDTARSRRLGGTGLGLAIVKHIVNRHRGALTIESTLGVGSVFTVYLPVAAAKDAAAKDVAAKDRPEERFS